MNITIEEKDDALVAILEGRLDTAAAATTEKELSPLYNANGKNIVFDCKQLQYISSSGLRIFLGVLKSAQPKGSHVRIINLNDDLKKIFFMTGFNNLFEFV
ncbi:MAG: STAS domain-containing protein [Marinilabiliaceae bacterium]|nr:STAS domain-containing protein [Marinilabiliaceae bacterium]